MNTVDKDRLDQTFFETTADLEQEIWDNKIVVGHDRNEYVLGDKEAHFKKKAFLRNRGKQLLSELAPTEAFFQNKLVTGSNFN